MTERNTPAKKGPAKHTAKPEPKQDESNAERELTAGTAEPAPEEQVDDQAGRTVSPPLGRVDEHQSIAADVGYVVDDTVEPDPEKVDAEQAEAADVAYLDSRTTHPGHVAS